MKIDRLLEIVTILLNKDTVSAKTLADHFEVSVRTIQRDMISISLAGIPIYSTEGKNGGYSIISDYKVKSEIMKPEEQQLLVKALESLATTYSNESLEALVKKYNAFVDKQKGRKIYWDFGVTKENQAVQDMNAWLERAIADCRIIKFDYRNGKGEESVKTVQPLAIHYKWYAWYLFGWSYDAKAYRTYKVARVKELKQTEEISEMSHGNIEVLMKECDEAYYRTCRQIEIHFSKESIGLMEEYFPDSKIELLKGDTYRVFLNLPLNERLWKALLLSFGNKITVISPVELKQELINTAKSFLANYDPGV